MAGNIDTENMLPPAIVVAEKPNRHRLNEIINNALQEDFNKSGLNIDVNAMSNYINNLNSNYSSSYSNTNQNVNEKTDEKLSIDNLQLKGSLYEDLNDYSSGNNVDSDSDYNILGVFPKFSVDTYTKSIYNWRRQINPFGTKGFFYFKIYFNFNTNYGLLGGNYNNLNNINTASGYLKNLANLYDSDGNSPINLKDRVRCLTKFINGLSYVSEFSPWFFKGVNGLNEIRGSYVDVDDFENKNISIICGEESLDMRLGTLFDLYNFAIYDNLHNKEIIPKNLRKFEMSILFFHIPIKKYQTGFTSLSGNTFNNKEIDLINTDNTISFKLFTFLNCEFDQNSLNEFQDSISNESAFDLGKNQIKINYDRVIEHRMNEWEKFGFGDDRIFADDDTINVERLKNIESDIETLVNLPRYRYYVPESKLQNRTGIENENGINSNSRYNTLYFEEKLTKLKTHKFVQDNLYSNFTNVRSKYYLDKLKHAKEGTIERGNIYGYDFGRTGEGTYRRNTRYLDKKLDNLKFGTINRDGSETILDESLATPNMYSLSWEAEAIRNSNNMYAVDGIQSNKKTWLGKLAEATWNRTKTSFGF